MTNTDYDLIVLGGGMAGLPVAMKCGYSGMDVALVEEGLLGGRVSIAAASRRRRCSGVQRSRTSPAGAKSSVSISTAPSSQT